MYLVNYFGNKLSMNTEIILICVAMYAKHGSIGKKGIVGIAIGSFVAVVILVVLVCLFIRRKKEGNQISVLSTNFHSLISM